MGRVYTRRLTLDKKGNWWWNAPHMIFAEGSSTEDHPLPDLLKQGPLPELAVSAEQPQLPEQLTISVLDWRNTLKLDASLSPIEEGILEHFRIVLPTATSEVAGTPRIDELFRRFLATVQPPSEPTHRQVIAIVVRGPGEAATVFGLICQHFTPQHPLWGIVHVRILYPSPKDPSQLDLYGFSGAYVPILSPDERDKIRGGRDGLGA